MIKQSRFSDTEINIKNYGEYFDHTNIKERKIQSFTAQQHVPKRYWNT
jgi:hypothetical protein